MGRKFGGLGPLFGEGSGVPSKTKSPGPSPTSIPSSILIPTAIWPQQIWAKNWWGVAPPPFGGGGAGFPSNTMWPEPRPTRQRLTRMPSFILIRPTVWPQYTNVADRQTGQTDNGPIA